MDQEGIDRAQPVEPPRGMYPGRLDEKGRLKLPVPFVQYLNGLTEKKLFVTSLDRRIAQLYPIGAWRENEKLFESYCDNPQVAQDVLFNAADLGAESEMDAQGRVLFNSELRKELDLAGQELHLFAYKGRVEILTEALYQERKQRASKGSSDNVNVLERAGLK